MEEPQNEIKLEDLAKQTEVVKTFEDMKNPNEIPTNQIDLEKIQLNQNTEIINTNLENLEGENEASENVTEEEKKKKKKKKKKAKKDLNLKVENENKEEEEEKKRENTWRKLFNFSEKELSNSRFQDNSVFRVLKNWQEGPWNQT